jgi:hypothetical protein
MQARVSSLVQAWGYSLYEAVALHACISDCWCDIETADHTDIGEEASTWNMELEPT